MGRKNNGDGSTRQLTDGSWECVIQSKYINPKTGNPKRIKRNIWRIYGRIYLN